ncbi:MAG: hypothetical protein M3Q82_04915, partial [Actinomycetota bacterium]|nr:hypothetical protein [Actinomycetota bacterium]
LTPGAQALVAGDFLQVGPLNVLLTRFRWIDSGWLITGTVTRATLLRAGRQLDGEIVYLGSRDPP